MRAKRGMGGGKKKSNFLKKLRGGKTNGVLKTAAQTRTKKHKERVKYL